MTQLDPEMEQRVWQRVNGIVPQSGRDTLPGLMAAAGESAAAYRQLAKNESGRRREKLLRLGEEEMQTALALRGMLIMEGTDAPRLQSQVGREQPRRMLAGCLRRCRETQAAFAAREQDSEYGPVFRELARREAAHTAATLELMGE